ncbi:hypothetical protein [Cellulomonas iranensis]|uniref:hypothetical protein n=1 Tax=Cellulomonas iranensis TaxID=76862 RepID=UPI0013D81184|nr:hypothetical protein [Cellulomonas iranensis]
MSGISVEVLPDAGAPQVGVTVTGLDGPGVVSVDVSWDGGGTWHGVRGAQRVALVGGGFFRDHVPPLNREARYRLVVGSGTLLPTVVRSWDAGAGLSASTERVDGVVSRRNRIANPSFEVSTAGVTAGSTVTLARSTSSSGSVGPAFGTAFLVVTGSAAPTIAQSYVLQFLDGVVSPGDVVAVAVRARRSGSGATHMRMTVQYYDASTSVGSFDSAWLPLGTGPLSDPGSRLAFVAGAAPAGTTRARVVLWFSKGSSTLPADPGFVVHLDGWQADAAPNAAAVEAAVASYLDGDTPSVPATTEASITVPSEVAWLQDPLAPRTAVAVHVDRLSDGDQTLMFGSLASAAWQQSVDLATPMGAALPVAAVGQRILAGQVPVRLSHAVAAEGGALRRLLLSSGQLVVRGLPDDMLDPVAHVVVGDAAETRFGSGSHRVSTWDLTARQVRPQSLRIVVPWWTYDQVRELWAGRTYDQVTAARPGDTYLDWLRSPEVP